MEKITKCRICLSGDLKDFFDLGLEPPANALLSSPNDPEVRYPLALTFCNGCSLVQLTHTVPPEELFSKYVWVTGTSSTAKAFAERFKDELINRTSSLLGGYVLEIASNDGTFLRPFLGSGIKAIGIDPADNIAKLAKDSGVPTICKFFGAKVAEQIVAEHGKATAIFARNVLPHVASPRDFVKGVSTILSDTGTLAVEVHYARIIQEELHYDSIYHEHLCYFTLKTIERLLNEFGLEIFDVMESPISGGAVVVYAKKRINNISQVFLDKAQSEIAMLTNAYDSWTRFANSSIWHRTQLREIIKQRTKDGKKVVGYGASARSSTLLNFCGIDASMISGIADKSSLKHGKYTSGTHIPIVNPNEIAWDKTEFVFVLAWNFANEIIKDLQSWGFRGECLIPLPGDPRISTV